MKELNTPEENEGLVTYTYDDFDRLLYRNVYDGDTISRKRFFRNVLNPIKTNATKAMPKKLLYQDVYKYDNNGQKSVRRVYQPKIEITEIIKVPDSPSYQVTIRMNAICRSPLLASGIITASTLEDLAAQVLYFRFLGYDSNIPGYVNCKLGKDCAGSSTYIFNSSLPLYVKAFATVETGTLFTPTENVAVPQIGPP